MSKTNILHVRNQRKEQSKFVFLFDKKPVDYCKNYKYLGVNIDEHLDFKYTVERQADTAGRALGSIVTKMIKSGGFPYNVYSMLYNSCVTSISDYSAPITGFQEFDSVTKVHLRAIRAFLGVPKNACNVGILSEVNLPLPRFRTNLQMVRHYNRVLKLKDERLTKLIYIWDRELNDRGIVDTWSNEVKSVFSQCNLLPTFESKCVFHLNNVINTMQSFF